MAEMKPVEELTAADFKNSPVWEYTSEETTGIETWLEPVLGIPVTCLENRVLGTQVSMPCGLSPWAMLGNVTLHDPVCTTHFLTVSIYKEREWFHLARYHDVDFSSRGPSQLADWLGYTLGEVFPMSYDIRHLVHGRPECAVGKIVAEPEQRLSEDELIALAVRGSR